MYTRRGFPFSDDQLCSLAFELAKQTRRPGFSPVKKRAGKKWLKGFMKCKPKLWKKNAQNLSAAHAMAANPVQVEKFFLLLKQWVRQWQIEYKPNNIWNVNKTGISDVPKERRVIGVVHEHAFQTVADEKGTTTTLASFISAGGPHVPPMVIFKAGRVKDAWREAAPSGYFIHCSESGFINADLFAEYGDKFINFLKDRHLFSRDEKHLLLLDLHSSHLFNLKFIRLMNVLQPLDDVPYAVLKKKYQQELLTFNFDVAGAKMSKAQFFRVLIPAVTEAFKSENIRKGFLQTGIYPINPEADKLKELGPIVITDKCKSRVDCWQLKCYTFLCISDFSAVYIHFQFKF